jgi:hypothetical protein
VLPLDPHTPTTPGSHSPIRSLLLTGLALALLAVMIGPSAVVVLALAAAVALGSAAVVGRRHRRTAAAAATAIAAVPVPAPPLADPETATEDALTERLRRLYEDTVEQINMALEEGRDDLAQELSDSYMDQSLALITGGGHHSPNHSSAR